MLIKNRNGFDHFSGFFGCRRIRSAAIYGMSGPGLRLYEELTYSDVTVPFFIDRNAHNLIYKCPVYTLEESRNYLDAADCVIISLFYRFDEVSSDVRRIYSKPIYSLRELVNAYE